MKITLTAEAARLVESVKPKVESGLRADRGVKNPTMDDVVSELVRVGVLAIPVLEQIVQSGSAAADYGDGVLQPLSLRRGDWQ